MKILFKILYALIIVWILGAAIKLIEYLSVVARFTHDLVFFPDNDFDSDLTLIIALANAALTGYLIFHLFKFIKALKRIYEKILFSKGKFLGLLTLGGHLFTILY